MGKHGQPSPAWLRSVSRRVAALGVAGCALLPANAASSATSFDTTHAVGEARAIDAQPDIALADKARPPENPVCVNFTAEARYRSGYEHVVHIANGCNQPVTCDVSTDVTPQVITATIAAHASETVLTRRGSPASTFTAKVICKLIG